jgi:tetratricopeptide (TPR) repeat protein
MKIFTTFFILFLILSCKKNSKISDSTNSNIFYDKAHECRESGNIDSSYIYFDKAQEIFTSQKDSLGIGKCIVNKAIILTDKGDFFGGQELSLSAQQYFNKKDSTQNSYICSNYNNLGIASNNVKDYDNAIKYYDLAIKFADNQENKFAYFKNKANTYKDEKRFDKALEVYRNLLPLVEKVDEKLQARFLSNFENVKYLNDSTYNPVPQTLRAIEIEKKLNDNWGQNASYSHLIKYYLKKDSDLALNYANKMYSVAEEIKSPTDRLEALYYLTLLNPLKRLENFDIYNSLNDSIQREKDIDDNKFAFIRFDVEKNKNENQRLKLRDAENEIEILFRNVGIGALICVLIIGIFWYKKRKKRLQQEKELEVKNTQLKMSKRVHDVVANGIYQVMAKIENQEDFDRNRALDELEFVYEKSRDLSYEKAGEEKEFSQEISELIAGFNNTTVKTFTAGNDPSVWEKVAPAVKEEVYQMIRELMVNMKKHSQASHVAVKFEKAAETFEIQYKDNGVGISGDLIYKNGLRNTASRIEAIGGTITFDTKIEKGLKVNLSFPAS